MSEKEIDTTVEIPNTGVIEIPKFDCKPYIGVRSTITKVTEHQGKFGYYVKLESGKIAEFMGKDILATKILNLYEDDKGNIGWGEDTKTGQYLKAMDVSHYKDLVGKEVIIQTKTNKEGIEFLEF